DRFEHDSSVSEVADHAHSPVNRLILDSARTLGWRAHAAKVNAHDCLRAGTCGRGCKYGAKRGALQTYLPRALAAGARLYCNTRVDRIEQGRVHAGDVTIDCDKIILAAGAIGTPTLLQRSGLGNGEVGKHLRLHPTTAVVGIYDRPFYAAGGIPLTSYCNEFSDLRNGYGHWIESPPLSGGLAAIALPGFGVRHRAYMEKFPYLAPLMVLVRDGEPTGPSKGRVRARKNDVSITYRLGRSDRAALNHGISSLTRMHREAGARETITLHPDGAANCDPALFSAHVNGTCRISRNASEGACLPDGRVRECSDVYVLDGSLLPTAPGVNPHETIAAVTMILAERLK
ncbi:MAG TPA: GMC family oxidoreductase N-terminal domain-containing protein, partial [Longimicrobiales bacterium]|nr:GMC family oxidoreductase N-terminal domain-containing protein [Longimicrobiales bacterium]